MRHRTKHPHHPSHPADPDPSPSHPNAYTTDAEGSISDAGTEYKMTVCITAV